MAIGICNPGVAALLYLMGPNGTCTNRLVLQAAKKEFDKKKVFQWKDASRQVITDEEIESLLQVKLLCHLPHLLTFPPPHLPTSSPSHLLTFPSHLPTSPSHLLTFPPHLPTSSPSHLTFPPHLPTSPSLLTFPPHLPTSPSHLTFPPHLPTSSPSHLTTFPTSHLPTSSPPLSP